MLKITGNTIKITAFCFALLAPLSLVAAESAEAMLQRLTDRAEIDALVTRYVIAFDSHDADLYASVFTEDGEFEFGNDVRKGHAQIKQVIADLEEIQARFSAEGNPTREMYHVISNTTVDFIDENHAHHESYFQSLIKTGDSDFVTGSMGKYVDEIVKENGKWLIQNRQLGSIAP